MFFRQRSVPGLAIYSYMVGDEKTKECAVIDPTRDVEEYVETARAEGLHITHILETHVHADFVSGAKELKERLDGAPLIHCSGMGGAEWTPPYADVVVKDGDEIAMGRIDDTPNPVDGRVIDQSLQRVPQHGSAGERRILLGHLAAESLATTGSDDNGHEARRHGRSAACMVSRHLPTVSLTHIVCLNSRQRQGGACCLVKSAKERRKGIHGRATCEAAPTRLGS